MLDNKIEYLWGITWLKKLLSNKIKIIIEHVLIPSGKKLAKEAKSDDLFN